MKGENVKNITTMEAEMIALEIDLCPCCEADGYVDMPRESQARASRAIRSLAAERDRLRACWLRGVSTRPRRDAMARRRARLARPARGRLGRLCRDESSLLVTWGLRDYGTGTWEGGDEGCDHTPALRDGATSGPIFSLGGELSSRQRASSPLSLSAFARREGSWAVGMTSVPSIRSERAGTRDHD